VRRASIGARQDGADGKRKAGFEDARNDGTPGIQHSSWKGGEGRTGPWSWQMAMDRAM
jgi:hypothetical protein